MGSNPILNCSALVVRKSFTDYVQALNITTHGNLSLAVQCKREVCNALWGSGNPDISGIGVSIRVCLSKRVAAYVDNHLRLRRATF